MRLSQWLRFIVHLPRFLKLAHQFEALSFKARFEHLQRACIRLLDELKVEISVSLPHHLDLNETYYLVSNHQGTFDPILLVAAAPVAHSFISKVENLKLPVIGRWGRLI